MLQSQPQLYQAAQIVKSLRCQRTGLSDFETYIGKASTKGTPVSGNKFGEGATIKAWGFAGNAQMGPTFESPVAIPNLPSVVTRDNNGNWSNSPMAYWQDGKAHTFFACAPGESGATFDAGVFLYTVKDAVAEQADFMVADALKNPVWSEATTATPAKQSFAFRHALSQIKYSVGITATSEKATNVKITSVQIERLSTAAEPQPENFKNKGEISVIGRTDTNQDLSWTNLATEGTPDKYTVTPTTAVDMTNDKVYQINEYVVVNDGTDGALMLLPQETTGNVRFTVSLEYTIVPEPTDGSATTATASAIFTTTTTQSWAANKIYHYKLGINMPQVLNQKPIMFDDENMSIVPWDTTETVFNNDDNGNVAAPETPKV